MYASLTANLRAAVAETDPSLPVEETTYLGRPAWQGVFTVHEQWGMDGEIPMAFHWDATVDQATGPARRRLLHDRGQGQARSRGTRTSASPSLELDPALDPGWQRPAAPGRKTEARR